MIKKICDSCKKQINDRFVSVSYGYTFHKKDFCDKCSKSAMEYIQELFTTPPKGAVPKND